MINGELIVDNFAGGGGASTGIELATGMSVDIAINHDPEAIRMHKANHPSTKHYCESVWDVNPLKVYPRSEQVRRCGNAVCPPIPAALVKANLPELCVAERTPNMRIETEPTGQLNFA